MFKQTIHPILYLSILFIYTLLISTISRSLIPIVIFSIKTVSSFEKIYTLLNYFFDNMLLYVLNFFYNLFGLTFLLS